MTTADATTMINPILYVEELRRYPLRVRKPPVPGTCTVFRSRRGRLSAPPGGLTSGELWWRGPRVAYEVDLTEHPLHGQWSVDDGAPGGPCTVVLSGMWSVHSPIDVVAGRLTDAPSAATARLRIAADRAAAAVPPGDPDELNRVLRRSLPSTVDLSNGLRVSSLQLRARRRRPRDQVTLTPVETLRHLLIGSDSDDEDDLATLVRRVGDLARAADSVLRDGAGVPADERDAVLAEATQWLAQLAERFGELLAAVTGRSGN